MKQSILFSVLFFLSFYSNAQINYGVRAGVNRSNISKLGSFVKPQVDYNLGGFANLELNSKFSFQPGLIYSQQGVKEDFLTLIDDKIVETFTSKLNYNFLNIPLQVKYTPIKGLGVLAGPSVGLSTSANFKSDSDILKNNKIKNNNFLDFGLGTNVEYITPKGYGVNTGYNWSLTNIGEDSNVKHKVANLNLIYVF